MSGTPDERPENGPAEAGPEAAGPFVAADASDAEFLEHRYRRLLRAYPAAYRREREDEMVAVLMDSAAAGQIVPTAAEQWDLVRGGLRARLGLARSRPLVAAWLDVVATVAVVAPVVFAVGALIGSLSLAGSGFVGLAPGDGLRSLAGLAVRAVAWTIVSVCVLRGRDRLAGWSSLATAGAVTAIGVQQLLRMPPAARGHGVALMLPDVVLLAMVTAALLSPGMPARGCALLGGPLVVTAGIAGATLAYAALDVMNGPGGLVGPTWNVPGPVPALASALALALPAAPAIGTAWLAARRRALGPVLAAVGVLAMVETVLFLVLFPYGFVASALVQVGALVTVPLIAASAIAVRRRASTT